MRVVFSRYECFAGSQDGYAVGLSLANLVTREEAELRAVIDTGFDGNIMVDSKTYDLLKLGLSELPEKLFPLYRTFSGTIAFRSSQARMRMAGMESTAEVITPLHGGGKVLLGRRALGKLTTLLHRAEQHCIGEAMIG